MKYYENKGGEKPAEIYRKELAKIGGVEEAPLPVSTMR